MRGGCWSAHSIMWCRAEAVGPRQVGFDVRACTWSRWGPACCVKGTQARQSSLLRFPGAQGILAALLCALPFSRISSSWPGDRVHRDILDSLVPPHPWRGRRTRVRGGIKMCRPLSQCLPCVRPHAEFFSICGVSGWREDGRRDLSGPWGPRLQL